MRESTLPDILLFFLEWVDLLFVLSVGTIVLTLAITFIADVSQNKSALRRNYPVIARFRYLFEHMGVFFRQYFFTMDRQEMPFNRAQRSWVYRASKNVDNTVPFGSTRDLSPPGTVFFVNCPYPTLSEEALDMTKVLIGPYCQYPYEHLPIFNISGMSYGAISKPAVLALSRGAKKAGIWLNTGEGGLSPYHLEGGCDLIFQIGTAKFGIRDSVGRIDPEKLRAIAAHEEVKLFELKISQGAKPGKGGILPGIKVTDEIAIIRGLTPGMDAISPNRHLEVSNNADLLDLIGYIRTITKKPVGFKAVMGDYQWMEDLCKVILERGIESAPDFITIDSADGGTGAAPMSLLDYMGLPIQESLPKVVDIIIKYGLRDRIKIIASGKLITPSEVAWAICAGADFVNSARGFMFSLGCIQALHCHNNTCPTGITTHNKRLQKGLNPYIKCDRVAAYALNIRKEIGVIAHSCGVKEARQLTRHHVRIKTADNTSISMAELYPYPIGTSESDK